MSLGRRLILAEAPEVTLFKTVLYTGNGGTKSVTGVGFQPDLVWIKSRDSISNHDLIDSVRGATKVLEADATYAEFTESGNLTSFDTDGFTVGNVLRVNKSGDDFVAWNFKAGNSTSTNNDGDITSTVSVNSDAGFSIVSYTGDADQSHTIGHGLSSTPELIIVKNRTATNSPNWAVWHKDFAGTTNNLFLNLTASKTYATGRFGTVNSTTFKGGATGGNNEVNGANPMIAYCFHSASGISRISSYTGTGASHTLYTTDNGTSGGSNPFQPSFVIIKRIDSADSWQIYDNQRGVTKQLEANTTNAEYTQDGTSLISFNSNGFTLGVDNSARVNASGAEYIYIAFK